jgi:hypothetical protein
MTTVESVSMYSRFDFAILEKHLVLLDLFADLLSCFVFFLACQGRLVTCTHNWQSKKGRKEINCVRDIRVLTTDFGFFPPPGTTLHLLDAARSQS